MLTGCERETNDDPEQTVSIDFTVGSMLKATAIGNENVVDEILIFTVDDQNAVVSKHTITQLSGAKLTISKKVKWLYAIANPTTTLKDQSLSSIGNPEALTWDFQTALTPTSKFPMSGKQEVNGASVSIVLVRLVAKINITANDPKFTDPSITVKTPRYGYIFARTPFAIPTPVSLINYTYTNLPSTVYVAENSGTSNLTEFIVNGKYDGTAINPAYTFNLKNGAQGINIVRNTYYEVPITFQYAN